jgi:biopolymer transport protein ExbD
MSRKNQRPEEEAQAIDLTPMLDVVFIMLIFFIVTALLSKRLVKRFQDLMLIQLKTNLVPVF